MPKEKIFKIFLFIMSLAFSFQLYNHALAGDCADKRDQSGIATSSGNANYTPDWNSQCPPEALLNFDDENTPDEIESGSGVTVYVTGGIAPFTYQVTSGTGATWHASGTTSYPSNNREVVLVLADGT